MATDSFTLLPLRSGVCVFSLWSRPRGVLQGAIEYSRRDPMWRLKSSRKKPCPGFWGLSLLRCHVRSLTVLRCCEEAQPRCPKAVLSPIAPPMSWPVATTNCRKCEGRCQVIPALNCWVVTSLRVSPAQVLRHYGAETSHLIVPCLRSWPVESCGEVIPVVS